MKKRSFNDRFQKRLTTLDTLYYSHVCKQNLFWNYQEHEPNFEYFHAQFKIVLINPLSV